MEWNKAYRREAEAIAASVVGERGYLWKAAEIEKGARSRSEEVEIAMSALMLARGEYELPRNEWGQRYRWSTRSTRSRPLI